VATVATRQRKNLVDENKKKTPLTPTGLLMEGDYTNGELRTAGRFGSNTKNLTMGLRSRVGRSERRPWAIAQACASCSPGTGSMSVMGIFQQLGLYHEIAMGEDGGKCPLRSVT
jgi:hypothetical protein